MKKLVDTVMQIAVGVTVGYVFGKGVEVVAENAKKAVEKKAEKSRN